MMDQIRAALRDPGGPPSLKRRRTLTMLAIAGLADAAVVLLHQMGIVRRLPDPPLPGFDSNAVVSSPAAYALGAPDASLSALQLSSVLVLAGALGTRASGRRPILDLLLGLDVLAGAVAALAYLGDMIFHEKKACAYCIPAAAISLAMVPFALPLLKAR